MTRRNRLVDASKLLDAINAPHELRSIVLSGTATLSSHVYRRTRWFHSPGWFGLRLGRCYWVLRDVRRHKLRFSERNRSDCRRLARLGPWEFWLK